jgi:methyltransferase
MSVLWIVLVLVALQRVAELAYARRNTDALRRRGGIEWGAGHYPLIVLLHAAWLASMAAFIPPLMPPVWPLLIVYVALQAVRGWSIASLGPFWTTRVIIVPNTAWIRNGPYRFMRHPNYAVVCAEIAILPLAFHALALAVVFSVLNAALVLWRIRVEEQAVSTLAAPSLAGTSSQRRKA